MTRPDYKAIVADYKKLKSLGHDSWLSNCATTRDLLRVIEMAAMARDLKNDKHPHQHRISNTTLRKFADRLLRNTEGILSCGSFDHLYDLINSVKSPGIGPLTVYDTAQRIGARLRLRPERVYMHRGTRVGAERYLGRKVKEDAVHREEFPHFKGLPCDEIEDILCIYKDDFLKLNSKSKRSRKHC